MKAIHIVAIIAISFVAGMFGGTFSERVFADTNDKVKIHDQIIARAFHLVDKNNKRRASMGFSRDGQPVICVNDQNEIPRGYLGYAPAGPMLALLDKAGESNIILKGNDDGSSMIALMKDANHARLIMNYKPGRGPALALYDENNVGKALVTVVDGKAGFGLYQADKKPAVALFYDSNRQAALLGFLNSRNEAKAGFGLMDDKPLLFAYRPDDTGLLFNIQRDGRPALGLLTGGRPEWSATGTVPQMPALDGILDQVLR